MRRRNKKLVVAAALAGCTWSGAAFAQGRGGQDWTTAGGDAQRTSWVRSDARITKESVQSPEFRLAWKARLENTQRQLYALSPTADMGATYGLFTITQLLFVAGSGGNVYGIDSDLGRVLWTRSLATGAPAAQAGGSLTCPGGLTSGVARPTALAPAPAAGPGRAGARRGGRGGSFGGAVGEPFAGAPNLPPMPVGGPVAPSAPSGGRGAGAAGAPGGRGGGGGRGGVNSVYAVSGDGYLHSMNVQNGAESAPPIAFLPANSSPTGLISINNVVYAATGPDCGGAPNGIWALDLNSPARTISNWKSNGGSVAGQAGPAFGSDGTVYVALGKGESGPGHYANSVVSLEAGTLKTKDWFSTAKIALDSTPVVFPYKGKDLVAVSASDGRLYLLDGASLGGADHQTPLDKTAAFTTRSGGGALTSYVDADGVRWILAPAGGPVTGVATTNGAVSHGAVVAFKLSDRDGKLSLEPAWASRDMTSPAAPLAVGGVLFALSGGESRSGTLAQRIQNSVPAVLYALDPATGKELWSSGKTIASFVHSGALSAGAASVYLSTYDNTLYAFGFPMER